jgi:hypothetical protein
VDVLYVAEKYMKKIIPYVFLSSLVVAIAIGYMLWSFNQPPFPLSRLDELNKGMTEDEVRRILGEPNTLHPRHWTYSRLFSWSIVHITFDSNGRFLESDHDY